MSALVAVERILAVAILVVHAGLIGWGLVGFAELGLPHVPWRRLSNPQLSTGMLLVHWTLITAAGATFVLGFATRWPRTPAAMAWLYAAMALVCAYQTFFVLTSPTRFRAMAIEYAEYALILAFLFLSRYARARFG
jgi:hypothetical protein